MDVNGTEYDDVDRIVLAQNGTRWQAVVNAVMKLRALQNAARDPFASKDGLCCVKLIGSVN